MTVSRRTFLKSSAAVTAISATSGVVANVLGETKKVTAETTLNKWRGRVAINFNKDAVKDYAKKSVDNEVIAKMVDDTIIKLSEKDTVGDAWKEIFPDTLTATSKIAIKTNFYAPSICPPPEILLAMVTGLRKMSIGGSNFTGDITIYEANTGNSFQQAGYDEAAFKVEGSKATLLKATMGKGKDPATGESQYVTVLDDADFLINVFSARGHEAYTEGFSLGFKSHYGTYINSPVSTIHGTPGFSQRVRNLHCTGVIAKKQVLSVSCAFYCNNEGDSMGSTGTKSFSTYVKTMDSTATCESPSTLIMSTDAVSCEVQAIKILKINKGKTYGVNDMPKYLRASAGIAGALSDATYDIGEIDELKMDIRKIVNQTGIVAVTRREHENRSEIRLTTTSLPRQRTTYFEFSLPSRLQGTGARLSVFDITGKQIFSTDLRVQGILNHYSWDRMSGAGMPVPAGRYVVELTAADVACRELFLVA